MRNTPKSILAVLLALCLLLCACAPDAGEESQNTDPTGTTGVTEPYVDHAVTVGDHQLDSVAFHYYYVDAIGYFYNAYYEQFGSYASLYLQLYTGIDPSAALGEQTYDEETGQTWADYFVEQAKNNAKWTYAMTDRAKAEGYELPEDVQKELDSMAENMEKTVTGYGYDSFLDYVQSIYGSNATVESFMEYYSANICSNSYASDHYASLTYTEEDYREYEKDRYFDFSSYTYAGFYLDVDAYLALQKGTTDSTTGEVTYSEEEKAAAVTAMLEDANALAGCTTQEALDAALAQLTVFAGEAEPQTSSVAEDILLFSVTNPEIAQWLGADGRKVGDTGCITDETDGVVNGCYVLLLLGYEDNTMPLANVRHVLIAFKGGTTDSTTGETVYSDAEKAAAKTAAEILLKDWLAGDRTDESFAELANKNSDDSPEGGLYEDITPDTKFEESFLNWCFEGHEAGDTGIVESVYGYHIMYYQGDDELTYRDYLIRQKLLERDMEAWETEVQKDITVTEVDLSCVDRTMTIVG